METRIKIEDTVTDMIVKLSDGNPGAVNVMCCLLKEVSNIDKQSIFQHITHLILLDNLHIYGSDIWVLFKYICDTNMVIFMALLRWGTSTGVRRTEIKEAIEQYRKGLQHHLNLEEILKRVKEELPGFDNPDYKDGVLQFGDI